MLSKIKSFPICWSKALFFGLFVMIWLAQPVVAKERFRFGDAVPSFNGGYYIDGIPSIYFLDTGEKRLEKAGRVWAETIGGLEGVGTDISEIFLFPVREPLLFGAGAAGIGLLIANDYKLTTYYQDYIEPAFDWFTPKPLIAEDSAFFDVFPALAAFSIEDQYVFAGIGLTYAYGIAANDERAQATALLASKAVVYSEVVTQLALKPLFGRARPFPNLSTATGTEYPGKGYSLSPFRFGESLGPSWKNLSQGTGLPSFHYTEYFAVARVYSGMYDNSWLPYVAAGVVSVANIRGHRHWVGDMAAGALVGTVIGQTILNNYAERKGIATSFTPVVSTKSIGGQFSMRF